MAKMFDFLINVLEMCKSYGSEVTPKEEIVGFFKWLNILAGISDL